MQQGTEEIIMAGFGGQGILFLGKVLAQAGMIMGHHVSWLPSYGPEMRGGTANCTVILSDHPIASPIVAEPDTLIAMNRPSVDRFQGKVKPGGLILYNSSLIDQVKQRDDVRVAAVPASAIADEIGSPRVANLVMVGAYLKNSGILKFDDVLKTLPSIIPSKKKEMSQVNIDALKRGFDSVH
ncbi:MAG: 2-oxoacid:acceptor oxidoreductase family protein [Candidatus Riflebacteria bacterium]|nr:2-oxoacid:acceptor oxidoreductase family protein [Candidatus Riflebacteria bacterium]